MGGEGGRGRSRIPLWKVPEGVSPVFLLWAPPADYLNEEKQLFGGKVPSVGHLSGAVGLAVV